MQRTPNKIRFRLSAAACLTAALLLLVLPIKWLIAALAAAVFHELCHVGAIRLCGGKILGLSIGGGGAVIKTEPMEQGKALFCALAGPFGGLCLLLAARWIPRTAVCAGIQSLYNLLPLYPLDGGRALRSGAAIALPPKQAERLCGIIEELCRGGLVILAVYAGVVLHLGIFPFLLVFLILLKTKSGKIPCKHGPQRVQ